MPPQGAARELSRLSEAANDNNHPPAPYSLLRKQWERLCPDGLSGSIRGLALELLAWNYLSNAEPEGMNDLGHMDKVCNDPTGAY